ncbi:MAG: S41 family peptidase [Bacteriovoracales bacterium]|nr:S41 family peptidase [Bacteriovoracales bacterium]
MMEKWRRSVGVMIPRHFVFIMGIFLYFGFPEICFSNSNSNLKGEKKEESKYEYLDLFSRVLNLVENQYYREVDTEKLMEGAIRGMLSTLDPHSSYLDQKALKKIKNETAGEFGGLGVEVTSKEGVILVITPFEDTPAFRAGIKSGDKIVEIEHESTLGIGLDEAVEKMRGKPGSKINIGIIKRGSQKIDYITLEREVIKIRPVKSELLEKSYAYIRLAQFQEESSEYIEKHLKKLLKKTKKLKGIVFDLRSNPGGLLTEAVKVASIFLSKGVVVSTEGRDPKKKEVREVIKGGFKDTKTPMVVLINGASASASEIVAGALKDHRRAIIMGGRSFGKGSVQTVLNLDKTKGIKMTIQQYMTPDGKKIQAKGIMPDVKIAEVGSHWTDEMDMNPFYVREQDLRNHLSAAIEMEDEKKSRLQREKESRALALEKSRLKKSQKKKGQGDEKALDDFPRPFDPKKDFQVHSAISYLKSFEFYENFHGGEDQKRASR